MTTLADLKENESGIIVKVNSEPKMKRHLVDMGVSPGGIITFIRKAPLGDPRLYVVMGYRLGIRYEESKNIIIERADNINE